MRIAVLAFILIFVLLLTAGFSYGQTITTTPAVNSTRPGMVSTTTGLGSYGDWSGYTVDQHGTSIGGIPVTLHIMGNYSNGTAYEIINVTRITNSSPPSVGYFNFNDVIINLSGVSAPYGYLDAIARTADNRTLYGRSINRTLMYDSACTVGSVVLTASVPGQIIQSSTTSSPVISVNQSNVAMNQKVTVSGRNFTPNGIAVLYVAWNGNNYSANYTANVDRNGNTSWSFNVSMGAYTIYALDGNFTGRESNTLTVNGLLNDATPSLAFQPAVLVFMATCAIFMIRDRSKKK